MFEKAKKYWEENQLAIVVAGLTGLTVVVSYYAGYYAGSFDTAKLWFATQSDYELFNKFLSEHGLREEFNALLQKRPPNEGSLKYLLSPEQIKYLETKGL